MLFATVHVTIIIWYAPLFEHADYRFCAEKFRRFTLPVRSWLSFRGADDEICYQAYYQYSYVYIVSSIKPHQEQPSNRMIFMSYQTSQDQTLLTTSVRIVVGSSIGYMGIMQAFLIYTVWICWCLPGVSIQARTLQYYGPLSEILNLPSIGYTKNVAILRLFHILKPLMINFSLTTSCGNKDHWRRLPHLSMLGTCTVRVTTVGNPTLVIRESVAIGILKLGSAGVSPNVCITNVLYIAHFRLPHNCAARLAFR